MFRRRLKRDILFRMGARARAAHSAWLTEALGNDLKTPRIPTRRVTQGGFEAVTAAPGGREWADEWWNGTLDWLNENGPGKTNGA